MPEIPEEKNKSDYLVLARKYRPKKFSEVVGQPAVVRTLQNAIRENRIAHAYLFSGMRGVGKTTVARILAKALNCEHGPTPEPCNQCFMCTAINEDRLLDFIEIDGASNRGIEDVKALRESIQYEPMHSRYRVIIIDEVHQLSRDAFNALLKTLEEPPTRTVFIFATTEFHKVPKTIASRCQHFVFKKLSPHDIIEHLTYISGQEGFSISPYSLKLIAEAADGSLRDAETLLDQVISFSGFQVNDQETEEVLGVINRQLFENFSRAIISGQPAEIFSLVEALVSSGYDLRYFYSGLIEYFRHLLVVKMTANPERLLFLPPEEINKLKEQAKGLESEEILRYILLLQEGESGLKYSSQPRIFLESCLVKLCFLPRLKKIEKALDEIEEIKKELKTAPSSPKTYPAANSGSGAEVKQPLKTGQYQKEKKNPSSQNGFPVFGQKAADEFYYRLLREKPALAPILRMASRVEVKADLFQLIYAPDKKHFAALIEQNLPYLSRLALEVAQKKIELKIEGKENISSGQPDQSRPETGKIREEPAAEALLQDPKARAILNTFRGQVVSIKKKAEPERS
ncbi:MAG: DNA polymerase III subunit gamma/tau [Candidatus Saccharicenans sp.]|nr:MAG: DNA polymerase III subunit gamma/tau [Candidatus Aminicenantes bacterium]HEK85637.1 DNA polymerase III subunit gamma/tau [Candidatus Aminicenantes bacterium]